MSAICDAHKKTVDVERLYNPSEDKKSVSWRSDELEIRRWIEDHVPERLGPQAPGWAAQENGKETRLWPEDWGSICSSSFRSTISSHTQPFQIKWEVYFSKELCRSSIIVSLLWFCMHMCLYSWSWLYYRILRKVLGPEEICCYSESLDKSPALVDIKTLKGIIYLFK